MTPAGTIPATGNSIDVPCCDVFHMRDGKIVSFHCYNAASILQRQLDLADSRNAS
nr:nuclear transport factor 2 family protein [Pseudorhizobium halotolerans]